MSTVTDLKQYVLEWVNAVKRRPAIATDPSELDSLESAALTSFQGAFSATHAPIAPMNWEMRTLFMGNTTLSERVSLDVPFPCMIVGMFAAVEPIFGAAGVVPTATSIDVQVDLNEHEYMTSAQGTVTPIPGGQLQTNGNFVTLQALAVNGGQRLLGWVIPYRTAQIGMKFRWKQGANVYANSHVGVTLYARALQEQ